MINFNYKRRNLLSGPHLAGSLLIIAGLIALLSPLFIINGSSIERAYLVGAGALIIGLVIISSYGGTIIDFSNKKFKDYFSICGFKYGEWTSLPVIKHVTVVSISYISKNTPNGISPTLSGKVTDFRTLLYSDKGDPAFSFIYSDRERAVKQAKYLACSLDVNLIQYI